MFRRHSRSMTPRRDHRICSPATWRLGGSLQVQHPYIEPLGTGGMRICTVDERLYMSPYIEIPYAGCIRICTVDERLHIYH